MQAGSVLVSGRISSELSKAFNIVVTGVKADFVLAPAVLAVMQAWTFGQQHTEIVEWRTFWAKMRHEVAFVVICAELLALRHRLDVGEALDQVVVVDLASLGHGTGAGGKSRTPESRAGQQEGKSSQHSPAAV